MRRPSRRMLIFLAASVALHLLGFALVFALVRPWTRAVPAAKKMAEAREVFDLELPRQVAPHASQSAPPGTKLHAEARGESGEKRAPSLAGRASSRKRVRAQSSGSQTGVVAGAPSSPQGPGAPGKQGLALNMRPLDLNLDPSSSVVTRGEQSGAAGQGGGLAAKGAGGVAKGSGGPEGQGEGSQSTKKRLDQLLAKDAAEREFQSGRVHPQLYDIQRAAEVRFKPDWSLTANDQRHLGTMKRSVGALLRGWAKSYAKALRESSSARARGPGDRDETEPFDVHNRAMRYAEEEAEGLSCELCVTIRWGKQPEVQVVHSSQRAPFNRMAIAALREAIRPGALDQHARPVKACYRFVATFQKAPPLPVAGCTFDEVKLSLSCYYPGKKMLRANVKLISVEPLTEGERS